ncbi:medium-chain acyl-CoA ligase ACSF2, mitochondrial-like [Ylistrum balloti]|uniref:medium-chain acyl-CoA ligase ACSF2, mitochondrial-like n=1 Tax=Ylistrum balloti TaxID=509963 RepID=UPI0029058136|nr:medium-chain acyl-CoA ligase ACSF2, mitochondrial-like [Ylistrum balloti]
MSTVSYLHNPPSGSYQYITINDVIKKNAEIIPNTEAFVYRPADGPRQSITYGELYKRAVVVARFLVSSGVQKQDMVGLFGPNTLARIVAEFGIILSGAVVLQLNIEYKNAEDAIDILDKSKCEMMFADPGNNDQYLSIIESLETSEENNPQRRQYILLRETKSTRLIHKVIDEITTQAEDDVILPKVNPEDDAFVFTTSGSTGKPKLVVHSQFFMTISLKAIPDATTGIKILYNDRPFCWIGGSVVMSSMLGQTRVFTDPTMGTTENGIKKIWDIMREEDVMTSSLMPYHIYDLIKEATSIPDDGYRLEMIASGGQIVDNFYTQVIGRFCRSIIIGYGSSEAAGVSYSMLIKEGDFIETGKIGPPIPGVEIRIVDDDGCIVATETHGNIQVRSALLMKRYHMDTALTSAMFTNDRPPWLKTGDIGLLTSSGDLIVQGRTSDTIARGGRKILPGAIDDLVKKMEGIRDVVTVAVPDTRMYEEACVCYISSELTPAEVQSYCENNFINKVSLDGMGSMPRYFLKFNEFPTAFTGKTDKKKLKTEAARRLNLD